MTPVHMTELALRKRMLQQRSAVLRHTFAIQFRSEVAPLAGVADRAFAAGRWMWRHPLLLVAGAVAVTVWRPNGLSRLAGRGLLVWRAWQHWQPLVRPVLMAWRGIAPADKAILAER
jgi:YqjK-like protein